MLTKVSSLQFQTKQLKSALQPLIVKFNALSTREKLAILAAFLILSAILIQSLSLPIIAAFDRQKRKLAKLEQDWQELNTIGTTYSSLRQRFDVVQSQFQGREFKEGVRSHIEKLIREQLKLQAGQYTIGAGVKRPLAGSYSLAPFSIKFDSTSLEQLVSFLEELVQGPQGLLLTKLEIVKSRRGDKLTISADVSSIAHN